MAPSSGTKLVPYEIIAPLGAGGMGSLSREGCVRRSSMEFRSRTDWRRRDR